MLKGLNKQAELDVKSLVTETGHQITTDDLPALFDLNAKAERITNLAEDHNQAILEMPLRIGGVWLKHPTMARLAWLEHHESWLATSRVLYLAGCAFACSTDTTDADLDALLDQKPAHHAITKFGRKIKASVLELGVAIKSLLLVSEDGGGEASGGYWNIISFLSREFGSSPTYWRCEATIGEIISLLNEYSARQEHEAAIQAKRMKGKITTEKEVSADKLTAVREYREALQELKAGWCNG